MLIDRGLLTGQDEFSRDMISAHNRYRAKHNSPPLRYSQRASVVAQRWANHLAKQKAMQHGDHEGMGQNLAWASGKELTGEGATDMWYREIEQYNFNNPGFASGTGHFTQLVWAETREVGMGKASVGGQTFVVANYIPPGNVVGRQNFEKNVQRPK